MQRNCDICIELRFGCCHGITILINGAVINTAVERCAIQDNNEPRKNNKKRQYLLYGMKHEWLRAALQGVSLIEKKLIMNGSDWLL